MSTKIKPEASHNYQGVDLYTGKVFFSQKHTALYEPGTIHRSRFANYGSIINPRIPDRFGHYFNVDNLLENHCGFSLPDESGWSKPVAYSVLYHMVGYRGPLAKEGETLVVASHLIKMAEHQQDFQEVHYQFKHISTITDEERRSGSDPLVEADYSRDYKDEERCPEVPPKPTFKNRLLLLYSLQEVWEHLSRLEEAGELPSEEDNDYDEEDDNAHNDDDREEYDDE